MSALRININGKPVTVETGATILEATRGAKATVPTLCYDDKLEPFGACRVCMVEIGFGNGAPPKVVAACHTPVAEGMQIATDSPRVQRLRRNVVELIVSDHPLDCLTCSVNGNCELQDVAADVGVREVRYTGQRRTAEKDYSHPYIKSDLEKCIVCSRCVRACDEMQGQFVLSIAGRGFGSRVVAGFDTGFDAADCVSCGACVATCPTGALNEPGFLKHGAPDREVKTTCSYCGVGCNFYVQVKGDRVIATRPADEAAANQGHLCVKGRFAFGFVHSPERLTTPLIKRNGTFEEASWGEAIELVASRFKSIIERNGPKAIAGVSSSRCTNEENFVMQKFIRAVVGSNNIDCCARVCHSPTAFGMRKAFGTGAATNSFKDIEKAKLIMIIGANPTEAHPVVGARLKQAVLKGAGLIVIDPRQIELARYADVHLQLKPGTNLALFHGLAHVIVTEGLVDQTFIDGRTEGYGEYEQFIRKYTPEVVETITGVPAEQIRAAARLYATSGASAMYHGLGVTEHSQGSYGVMGLTNLAMLTGNVGREGVGVNPLRGQNNVQGAADMGAMPNLVTGYQDPTNPKVKEKFERVWHTTIETEPGYTIPEMFNAAVDGRLKAMWIVAEDMAQTDPNTRHVKAALDGLEFLVVQELFMTETAKHADVILPGASFLEKTGTFTNAERRVQLVRRVFEPLGGARTDSQIICDVARAMGYPMDYPHEAAIMDEIAELSPAMTGVAHHRLEGNGLQWPVPAKGDCGTSIVHADRFARGKGLFTLAEYVPTRETLSEEFPLILTTGRILEHYNAGTMTRRTDNLVLLDKDLLEISPEDAKTYSVADGNTVRVTSRRGAVTAKATVTDRMSPGTLFMTFHFPEAETNVLTSDEHDENTQCPEYKVTAVRIEKSNT